MSACGRCWASPRRPRRPGRPQPAWPRAERSGPGSTAPRAAAALAFAAGALLFACGAEQRSETAPPEGGSAGSGPDIPVLTTVGGLLLPEDENDGLGTGP